MCLKVMAKLEVMSIYNTVLFFVTLWLKKKYLQNPFAVFQGELKVLHLKI